MQSINSLIRRVERLHLQEADVEEAPGRILFFDESSYSGPMEAEKALQEIQENEDEPSSFVVSFRCQNREGLVYRDMIIPYPLQDLITFVQ